MNHQAETARLTETRLHEVIAALYASALQPHCWQNALHKMAVCFASPAVHLFYWDVVVNRPTNEWAAGDNPLDQEEVTQAATDYASFWGQFDYRLNLSRQTPAGTWFQCHEHFSESDIRREPFFNEYMLPRDFRWLAGLHILNTPELSAHIGVQRRLHQGPLNGKEVHALKLLDQHIAHASRMFLSANGLRAVAKRGLDALHAWSIAALLVKADGRIEFANKVAESLPETHKAVSYKGGRLQATLPAQNALLAAALMRAHTHKSGATLQLSNADQKTLFVTVYPLPTQPNEITIDSPSCALVTIVDPHEMSLTHHYAIQQIYGLTEREAAIATAIANGFTPKDIAQKIGVSINTVRSQIRSVFSKCGINRQTELVKIIASLPRLRAAAHSTQEK